MFIIKIIVTRSKLSKENREINLVALSPAREYGAFAATQGACDTLEEGTAGAGGAEEGRLGAGGAVEGRLGAGGAEEGTDVPC